MKSLKSELLDRNLRFDGVSEVEPDQLARFLLLGIPPAKLRVTEITPDVEEFNTQVSLDEELKPVADEPINLDMGWQLPEEYQTLDLQEYIGKQFEKNCPAEYTPEQVDIALDRIVDELREVEARGMVQFMQTVIYILDQLRANDILWGVGRGSSCASYLLYLVGLHVVDCVTMNVPMDEFYHD